MDSEAINVTDEGIDVELDGYDLINASYYASLMQGVKSVQIKNKEVTNRKICGQSDFLIHYVGMLGEIAVCKYLNVPFRRDITIGGDGNIDLTYKDQTVQIKTSSYYKVQLPRYLIFTNMKDFSTDWAIYCSIQHACVVRIHGFTSRKKFNKFVETKNFGYGDRYCLDEKYLSDISKFNEAIELPQYQAT